MAKHSIGSKEVQGKTFAKAGGKTPIKSGQQYKAPKAAFGGKS